MKWPALIIKYVIIPLSTIIGIIYSFDMYIIERAKTVVEPVKVSVQAQDATLKEIAVRTRNIEQILMERNK